MDTPIVTTSAVENSKTVAGQTDVVSHSETEETKLGKAQVEEFPKTFEYMTKEIDLLEIVSQYNASLRDENEQKDKKEEKLIENSSGKTEDCTLTSRSKKKIGNFFGVSNFSDSGKLAKFFGVENFPEEFYTTASAHYTRLSENNVGTIRKITDLSTSYFSAFFIAFLLYISLLAEVCIKVLPARFEPIIRRFVPKPEHEHSK